MLKTIVTAATLLFLGSTALAANPVVEIRTSAGEIVVELFPDKAPKTVENFLAYVKENHYAGTIFNRVVAGEFIQGGGRLADLSRKPRRPPIRSESDNGLRNVRGTVAASRFPEDPDSATSEFFINLRDNAHLDPSEESGPGYTVFGRVVSGMAVADRVSRARTIQKGGHRELPEAPVTILGAAVR